MRSEPLVGTSDDLHAYILVQDVASCRASDAAPYKLLHARMRKYLDLRCEQRHWGKKAHYIDLYHALRRPQTVAHLLRAATAGQEAVTVRYAVFVYHVSDV